jgi:putative transposase
MTYPSSLTDTQWLLVEGLFEGQMLHRKRQWPLRRILDAIFYVVKGGVQWRMMPLDLPCWQTVYYYYRKWRENGCWEMLHDTLSKQVRRKQGKEDSPSLGILDSQSVKTVQQGGERGYDAVKGRKRHLMVDTLGLLIVLIVHRADVPERQGARWLLARAASRIADFSRLKLFFADQGYGGITMWEWVKNTFRHLNWRLEIVNKKHKKVFETLPKRWIVERTFAWLNLSQALQRL